MTVKSPPVFLQSGSYVAQDLRQMVSGQAAPGVIHPGDFITSAGGGMSVNVSAGSAFVAGTEATTQGTYYVVNDAPVNLVVAASNPTNARNDLVILRVRDAAISGAFNDAALVVVTGVASGVPVDPAVPNNSVILGRLVIPALASSVIAGYIQDIRAMAVETWPSQATTGLIGAQSGTRAVGATAGGPPTTGTFLVGDTVVDRVYGINWTCITAGTPGSWKPSGAGPYRARARNTSSTSAGTGPTKIALQSKDYDPNGNFDAVTNYRYTVPIAGYYRITGKVLFYSIGDGFDLDTFIFKNGFSLDKSEGTSGGISSPFVSITGEYLLAAGDYIELYAAINSGSAATWNDPNNFSALTISYVP